jgi:hypothetical protein
MSLPPFWLLAGCKVLQAVAKHGDRARMLQTVSNLSHSVAERKVFAIAVTWGEMSGTDMAPTWASQQRRSMLGDGGTAFLFSPLNAAAVETTTICDRLRHFATVTTIYDESRHSATIPISQIRRKGQKTPVVEHKGLFSRRVVFPVYAASCQSVILLNKTATAFSICLAPGEMLADEEKTAKMRGLVAGRGTQQGYRAGGQDPRLRDRFGRIRQIAINRWRVGRAKWSGIPDAVLSRARDLRGG